METEAWLTSQQMAVIQASFLQAQRISLPGSLATLAKQDWDRVGAPVLQALAEVCQGADAPIWRKRILCVLWSRVLEVENGSEVEAEWQEGALFAAQSGLPHLGRTLLYELVKSMQASQTFAELLLCFPPAALYGELSRLVQYVRIESTAGDVQFFLDVWAELWRSRRAGQQALDQAFTAQCVRYTCPSSRQPSHACKRFKPDPATPSSSSCVPSVLLSAMKDMAVYVDSPSMARLALSNCLQLLYTSFLLARGTSVPPQLDLCSLAMEVRLRKPEVGLPDAVRVAQRELTAETMPSAFRLHDMSLSQALQAVRVLAVTWHDRKHLSFAHTELADPLVVRLKRRLQRVLRKLEELPDLETLEDDEKLEACSLRDVLKEAEVLSAPDQQCSSSEMACVAMVILDHRLEGHGAAAEVFAIDLAPGGREWICCLERNKDAFCQEDLVLKLVSTLAVACTSDPDVSQCRKFKSIIVDIFSELPLTCKNKTLAAMLSSWGGKGLIGFLPEAVCAGFAEELNLSFNSIIQCGTESDLGGAISAVARIAFQNPEAALQRCCHLSTVHLGVAKLFVCVLRQLTALQDMLCCSLKDAAWDKLSSPREEEQFLQFVTDLMQPSTNAAQIPGLLLPRDVVQTFVLPHLSPSSLLRWNLSLVLQLILASFRVPGAENPHWIMSCSPFPLLAVLCQLLDDSRQCWEEPTKDCVHVTIECRELLIGVLKQFAEVLGGEVAAAPDAHSRALSWLYAAVQPFDWTVRLYLHPVWGTHFKQEVPNALLEVCGLPEQEWCGLQLPQYGQGTGTLAWAEACCVSDEMQKAMLMHLTLDLHRPGDVNMFSKGLLVAVTQTLPWCTGEEWARLLDAVHELLASGRLHVPYSLEYVEFLPLLDLRRFATPLQQSLFFLRVFQLLCGSSCSAWLVPAGAAHAGRLYAAALRDVAATVMGYSPGDAGQEVLFVLTQLYCHVLHVHVMLQVEVEQLFLCALEVLTQCDAVLTLNPSCSSALQRENMRHFLLSITDNVESEEMKSALRHKIDKL